MMKSEWRQLIQTRLSESSVAERKGLSEAELYDLAFYAYSAIESKLLEELKEKPVNTVQKRGATANRWFMAMCRETSIFAIANLPMKKAILFRAGQLTSIMLLEKNYKKNIEFLLNIMRYPPEGLYWYSDFSEGEARKERIALSRWRTLAAKTCEIKEIEVKGLPLPTPEAHKRKYKKKYKSLSSLEKRLFDISLANAPKYKVKEEKPQVIAGGFLDSIDMFGDDVERIIKEEIKIIPGGFLDSIGYDSDKSSEYSEEPQCNTQ